MPKSSFLLARCIASAAVLGLACGGGGSNDSSQQEGTGGTTGQPEGGEGGGEAAGAAGSNQAGAAADAASGSGGAMDTPDAEAPPPPRVEFVEGIEVATLAGAADPGHVDGSSESARFDNPVNVAVPITGDVFVSDFETGAIRRINAAGEVSTVFEDPGLYRPFGIVPGADGYLYVEADGNTEGMVDTTTGTVWEVDLEAGTGTPIAENIGRPRGLAVAPSGSLVMADLAAHVIRTLDPSTGALAELAGQAEQEGFEDGSGDQARFRHPYGMDWLPSGELVIADSGNHAIRVVTLAGKVSTLAGNGHAGMVDGDLAAAMFDEPKDVSVAEDGTVYVTDTGNHRIRRISPDGLVQTLAGDGVAGYHNGPGDEARFFAQEGLDLAADGLSLIVADGTGGEPEPYNRVRILLLSP